MFPATHVGLFSALVLLSVFRFSQLARRAQLDVLLTLFELLAMLAYWRLFETRRALRARGTDTPDPGWLLLLHGATGLALLTKGPVGLLPLLVIALHLAYEGRIAELRRFFPGWGWGLSLGPVLIWMMGATLLAPAGFFSDAVLDNVFGRFLSGTAHVRPFYYFLLQLPIDFLPWTLLWPVVFQLARRQAVDPEDETRSSHRLLWIWVGTLLVFFSLSAGKRGLYLLPAFPAIALLCGDAIRRIREGAAPDWTGFVATLLFSVLGGLGLYGSFQPEWEISPGSGFIVPRSFCVVVAGLCGLALTLPWMAGRRGIPPTDARLGALFAGLLSIEIATFLLLFPAFDTEKSPRFIAEAAAHMTTPRERVAVYSQRALAGGISYYSGRTAVALETPQELLGFVRKGGRAIIIKARHREALESHFDFEERADSRHGRRRLLLVEAVHESAQLRSDSQPGAGDAAPQAKGPPLSVGAP